MHRRSNSTFNFSVPFLSYLAITLLLVAVIGLYLIPLRYLVLVWGINKFTKKLRNPNAVSNNELVDFLSRVPDNNERVRAAESKVTQKVKH
jgi:predicted PurR-regulated permease PerM